MNSGIIKWIIWLVGVLLIGGLGSGVWEHLLSPLFQWISSLAVDILKSTQSSYVDNIYRVSASNEGNLQNISVKLFISIIFSFSMFLYLSKIFNPSHATYSNTRYRKSFFGSIGIFNLMLWAFFIIISAATFFSTVKLPYIKTITVYLHKGAEIVRPNMTEYQYLEIRSQTVQIENKTDFLKVSDELKKFADINHVLPAEPDL